MAPTATSTLVIKDASHAEIRFKSQAADPEDKPTPVQTYKLQIVWRNVILFSFLHAGALYGAYLFITLKVRLATMVFALLLHLAGGFGITCGAHRLWAHRSYKATFPYRLMMVIFNCIALQNDVIEWSRDHRLHHKFSETDADPHNANRGLFFSHMGWLMVRKHPEVKRMGKKIDISDLEQDPMLAFQRRYYKPVAIFFCFVMPTLVPMLWGESVFNAYFVCALLRYVFTLHITWTVNSFAHTHGYRPYDKFINPAENIVSIIGTLGEGWHNYHHSFPYDYRASEWGWRGLNVSQKFIDLFARIGWVYDRKTVAPELIRRKMERSGDKEKRYRARQDQARGEVDPTARSAPVETPGAAI
jgi:stearoyl-CoA desaturase (delta-9 desaturase)